tara:strand:+ start:274 stop:456 length:183 start_codon:yes stop_codon:yes gene_type:complete
MIIPGSFVINPKKLSWGIGQVQSVINERITVNFENIGKTLININIIELKEVPIDYVIDNY